MGSSSDDVDELAEENWEVADVEAYEARLNMRRLGFPPSDMGDPEYADRRFGSAMADRPWSMALEELGDLGVWGRTRELSTP